VSRSLALDGAEVLVVMANWEAANIDEWKTYVRARAYENSLFVAAANRVGEDVTLNFGGESMVVGPRGTVYATLAEETDAETGAPLEGFSVARVDLDQVRKFREEFQFVQTRQPAVYRTIVKKY
jgi:predicted amidohydrolase